MFIKSYTNLSMMSWLYVIPHIFFHPYRNPRELYDFGAPFFKHYTGWVDKKKKSSLLVGCSKFSKWIQLKLFKNNPKKKCLQEHCEGQAGFFARINSCCAKWINQLPMFVRLSYCGNIHETWNISYGIEAESANSTNPKKKRYTNGQLFLMLDDPRLTNQADKIQKYYETLAWNQHLKFLLFLLHVPLCHTSSVLSPAFDLNFPFNLLSVWH